jgi:His-Xaa-Ser system protein HxsD
MHPENFIKDNNITYFADSKIFHEEVIFKCLYWYTDKFIISVKFEADNYYKIILISKNNLSNLELSFYLDKLSNDLNDFKLRDIVTKETHNIRDLLIAKAFSNYTSEEEPPGNII